MTSNPLAAQHRHRRDKRFELEALKRLGDDKIMAMAKAVPGFDELERIYGFHIERTGPDTLQMGFMHRSMGRMTVDQKKIATEEGPQIVYSLGPAGHFTTILYPAKSDLARVFEDHLFIEIADTSAARLIERMPQDLSDLVAYAHVSSIDLKASLRQKFRIGVLRLFRYRGEAGKFQKPKAFEKLRGIAGFGARTLTTAAFMSVLKPFGIAIAFVIALWLVWDWLAALLQPH